MQLEKTLQQLGFKPEDYTISGSDFSMTPKYETRRKEPAEFDDKGYFITEEVDVTPSKPSAEQLQAAYEEVQLKELDVAMLVSAYIEGKERDLENDSLNIVDGLIHSFDFKFIEKPTNAQLLALAPATQAKQSQKEINEAAMKYLAETDFYVIRMMDVGIPMPEGMQVLRQQARDRIVRD